MRVAAEIVLANEDHAELSKLEAGALQTIEREAWTGQRARIVLLAADGMQNKTIVQQLGVG